MLTLGLENLQTSEEAPVELSDVLSLQLEFADAYQAFIDYKNVCEIVVKAKASTESIEFASNLLNASVENIEVSAEGLGKFFIEAWKKFVELWESFKGWVKGAFNLFWNSITKKKDGTFSIEPSLGTAELEEIVEWMNKILGNSKIAGDTNTTVAAMGVNHTANRGGSTKLTTHAEIKAWCKAAKDTIVKIDEIVKMVSKSYKTNDKYYQQRKANANEEEDIKKSAKETRDRMFAAKTVMRIGPKVIKGIQATIKQVKIDYKEVKSR